MLHASKNRMCTSFYSSDRVKACYLKWFIYVGCILNVMYKYFEFLTERNRQSKEKRNVKKKKKIIKKF